MSKREVAYVRGKYKSRTKPNKPRKPREIPLHSELEQAMIEWRAIKAQINAEKLQWKMGEATKERLWCISSLQFMDFYGL